MVLTEQDSGVHKKWDRPLTYTQLPHFPFMQWYHNGCERVHILGFEATTKNKVNGVHSHAVRNTRRGGVLATWVTEDWRPTKLPRFPKYITRTLEKRRKDCLGIRAIVWTSPPHSGLAENEDHVLLTCSSFVVLGTTAASHNLRCSWLAHLVEMGASWQQCQVKWDPEEEGSVGRERCGRQAWVGMIGGDCWGMRDRYRRHGKESIIRKAPKPDFSCFTVFTRYLPRQTHSNQVRKRPGCFQRYEQPWNVEH